MQRAILQAPGQVAGLFHNYQKVLLNLHKRIARYVVEKLNLLNAIIQSVVTLASIAVKIGKYFVILGWHGHFQIGDMDRIALINSQEFNLATLVGKKISIYLTSAIASVRDRRINDILSHNTQLFSLKTVKDVEQ